MEDLIIILCKYIIINIQVNKTLLTIIAAYLVCWSPYAVRQVLKKQILLIFNLIK